MQPASRRAPSGLLDSSFQMGQVSNFYPVRMRWAGHVARMEEGRGVHKILVGKPEGKRALGDQDVDGRTILRWIPRKWEWVVGTGWSWLRIGTSGGRL